MEVLLVYKFNNGVNGNISGYGNALVELKEYPCTYDVIEDIEKDLKQKEPTIEQISILNIIPLKKRKIR